MTVAWVRTHTYPPFFARNLYLVVSHCPFENTEKKLQNQNQCQLESYCLVHQSSDLFQNALIDKFLSVEKHENVPPHLEKEHFY